MGKICVKKSSRVHIQSVQQKQCLNKNEESVTGKDSVLAKTEQHTDHRDLGIKSKVSLNNNLISSAHPTNLESNPFSGIKIKSDEVVKQKLIYPKVVTLPCTTLTTAASKQTKKIDKRKLRRELFLKKLEISQAVKIEEKKALQRAKTPVVGDMSILRMALPDLLSTSCTKSKKVKFSKRTNKKLPIHKKSKFKKRNSKAYYGLSEIKEFQKFVRKNKNLKDVQSAIMERIKTKCL